MEDVLPQQQARRQLRIGQGQESIELRLIFILAISATRHHDPAGTNVESQRLAILFGVIHRLSSFPRHKPARTSGITLVVCRGRKSSQVSREVLLVQQDALPLYLGFLEVDEPSHPKTVRLQ